MIKNYFKIAWRNIVKNKTMFGINIAGLALGLGSCLIIGLFVVDELSYDRFNKNSDRLVRVVLRADINGEELKEAVVAAPVAHTFTEDLPQVENATRLSQIIINPILTYNNEVFRDSKLAYADPNFFSLFTLPIVQGNSVDPLGKPNTLVITESAAKRYFGSENALGKLLYLKGKVKPLEITAVIRDVPENSHFHFDMFVSMLGNDSAKSDSWVNSGFATYLLLRKGADIDKLEQKLPLILDKYMGPQVKEAIGMSYSEFKKDGRLGLFLQPLTEIHLRSDFSSNTEFEPGGDIKYVYIFTAVALFMLLIACVNFINLSTATASKRSTEVGIKKVLGAGRKSLIFQFLTESFLATIIALVIALLLIWISLPFFNTLSGKTLSMEYLMQPFSILILLALSVAISLIAGSYPAFFLSAFKPIRALKTKVLGKRNTNITRNGLVVFQFVISAGLILATLVVYNQMDYIQQKNLGYDKEQLLVLRGANYLKQSQIEAYKSTLLDDPRVLNVTQSAFVPAGATDTHMRGIFHQGEYLRKFFFYDIDDRYIPTLGMTLIKGRNFSDAMGSENGNVIINEKAAEVLGLGDEVIGAQFERDSNDGKELFTVIGMVRDFNFQSLHKRVEPLAMVHQSYGGLIVKVAGEDVSGVIKHAQGLWEQYNQQVPFSYTFVDESFMQMYLKEEKMGTVLTLFALLTVLVACLGLFGLVTHASEQRFKEIGIRKVLGSSVAQIVLMLAKDFLKPVGLGLLIAFPLGFYLMNRWLSDFAYRIEINWWYFGITTLLTVLIAGITISIKSIKAALQNPVKSLKTE